MATPSRTKKRDATTERPVRLAVYVPRELFRSAKVFAAMHETTLSALVTAALERQIQGSRRGQR